VEPALVQGRLNPTGRSYEVPPGCGRAGGGLLGPRCPGADTGLPCRALFAFAVYELKTIRCRVVAVEPAGCGSRVWPRYWEGLGWRVVLPREGGGKGCGWLAPAHQNIASIAETAMTIATAMTGRTATTAQTVAHAASTYSIALI
jgi:hypothetical protein